MPTREPINRAYPNNRAPGDFDENPNNGACR